MIETTSRVVYLDIDQTSRDLTLTLPTKSALRKIVHKRTVKEMTESWRYTYIVRQSKVVELPRLSFANEVNWMVARRHSTTAFVKSIGCADIALTIFVDIIMELLLHENYSEASAYSDLVLPAFILHYHRLNKPWQNTLLGDLQDCMVAIHRKEHDPNYEADLALKSRLLLIERFGLPLGISEPSSLAVAMTAARGLNTAYKFQPGQATLNALSELRSRHEAEEDGSSCLHDWLTRRAQEKDLYLIGGVWVDQDGDIYCGKSLNHFFDKLFALPLHLQRARRIWREEDVPPSLPDFEYTGMIRASLNWNLRFGSRKSDQRKKTEWKMKMAERLGTIVLDNFISVNSEAEFIPIINSLSERFSTTEITESFIKEMADEHLLWTNLEQALNPMLAAILPLDPNLSKTFKSLKKILKTTIKHELDRSGRIPSSWESILNEEAKKNFYSYCQKLLALH